MTTLKTEALPIQNQNDIVAVRQLARSYATQAKLGVVDQTKLVTAVSELARNTLVYGKGGNATFEVIKNLTKGGIRITFEDKGPGIPDINLALQDHYTTGGGMGLGLGGAKRLVDEFDIQSEVNEGTRVSIVKWS